MAGFDDPTERSTTRGFKIRQEGSMIRAGFETFEILEGTAAYLLGRAQPTLKKGEHVLIPTGVDVDGLRGKGTLALRLLDRAQLLGMVL